jgi:hypothetical protein
MTDDDPRAATSPRGHALMLRVLAEPCPQVLLRVLGLSAQLDRIPLRVRTRCEGTVQRFTIALDGLSEHQSQVLLAKVQAIVTVRSARYAPVPRQTAVARLALASAVSTSSAASSAPS